MAEALSPAPLLTPIQLAEILSVPVDTLRSWRSRGVGPPALKVGRFVRYQPADVQAWMAALADQDHRRVPA